ncbi:MAG: DUF6259 domain-containing protein, partial [Planctomycetota bacterium]|nr:DUF6259 domain-containing protein [Planctomycetota bacterium]
AGARLAKLKAVDVAPVRLDWGRLAALQPAPSYIPNPAAERDLKIADGQATFRVVSPRATMRWTAALPEPIDLRKFRRLSVRYRTQGQLINGVGAYTLWLGGAGGDGKEKAVVPIPTAEIHADGQWPRLTTSVNADWTADKIALGVDAGEGPAGLTLGPVDFFDGPLMLPLAEMLTFTYRDGPWPAGQGGFDPLPASAVAGGRGAAFLPRRLGASDWFTKGQVTVEGVPFALAPLGEALRQTGTSERGHVRVAVPAGAMEVYLLTAAVAPPVEPFGTEGNPTRPIDLMDNPEKAVCEVRYEAGPPDRVLPIDVATKTWGVRRGLAVQAIHPDAKRRVKEIALVDGMENASFAIIGATVRQGAAGPALVREPDWNDLARALAVEAKSPPPALTVGDLAGGLGGKAPAWESLLASTKGGPFHVDPGPLFAVTVDGKPLPSDGWRSQPVRADRTETVHTLTNDNAKLAVELRVKLEGARLVMGVTLRNLGPTPTKAALRFPTLSGVRLGDAADTWYLAGRRGGTINRVPATFREPLGQTHPLQCDGFFNPELGLALACLTRDTAGTHHFINLAKTDAGGSWAPEYPDLLIPPGGEFKASDASVELLAGDWRAIFNAYKAWLKTWHRPPQEKEWWRRSFAFLDYIASHGTRLTPHDRGAIQPHIQACRDALGLCDVVHLYGWAASTEFGDWGDYGHYDQTVGGLAYFHDNIAKAQASGVAVSLYVEGYLNDERGAQVGTRVREWSMLKRDGTPNYMPALHACNQCPFIPAWQDYLSGVYGRLAKETGAKILYVDEYGATDGRWLCHSAEHGHMPGQIPYAGELAMIGKIRKQVGDGVALFCEYPPAEASRQFFDGSISYQALSSVDDEAIAPHMVDLPRFAFPAFKQFQIIHYVPSRSGNWWPIKFPFFNGESYFLGEPNLKQYDAVAWAFQKRAIEVLCAHHAAFSGDDVGPLVRTEVAGLFANRFAAGEETVWTLYNANGRSVRTPCLKVDHAEGDTYQDAWTGEPLRPEVREGKAEIVVDLDPKGIGCVVRKRAAKR